MHALAKNLIKLWPALWTFASVPDVEPTNNTAERGLRGAVIYRKLSLGSESQGGERTIERLLSVDQTCRLQRLSLYGYISELLAAKARGDPIPALACALSTSHTLDGQTGRAKSPPFAHTTTKRAGFAPYRSPFTT